MQQAELPVLSVEIWIDLESITESEGSQKNQYHIYVESRTVQMNLFSGQE